MCTLRSLSESESTSVLLAMCMAADLETLPKALIVFVKANWLPGPSMIFLLFSIGAIAEMCAVCNLEVWKCGTMCIGV